MTGTTDVLVLNPGATGTPDRIVRRPLAGSGDRIAYTARGITDFAEVGRSLVVVREETRRRSTVDLVALGADGVASTSTPVERITLQTASGRVSALHAAADGGSFGFIYADTSSGRSENVGLYVVDLTGTHMPEAIDDTGTPTIGAVPMTVVQWAYVPRTESALVRIGDDELFLVDMSGRTRAVRLGSAAYLHGFVGSGTTAVIETGTGVGRLDLTDGEHSALPTPTAATKERSAAGSPRSPTRRTSVSSERSAPTAPSTRISSASTGPSDGHFPSASPPTAASPRCVPPPTASSSPSRHDPRPPP